SALHQRAAGRHPTRQPGQTHSRARTLVPRVTGPNAAAIVRHWKFVRLARIAKTALSLWPGLDKIQWSSFLARAAQTALLRWSSAGEGSRAGKTPARTPVGLDEPLRSPLTPHLCD